ncbi:MAG: hypothetical protein AB2L20_25530 [Mangrovibacterium sp.]
MKFKQKLRASTAIIGLVSIVLSGIVFQGCQEDEIIAGEELIYLELSSSFNDIAQHDFDILNQARQRLENYVSTDGGKFVLKIASGSQINISEELFQYFQISIANANNQLEDSNYRIEGDRVVRKRDTGTLRLKSGVVEGDDGSSYVLYSGVDYTWYGMRINISSSDINGFSDAAFATSFLLSMIENTGIQQVDALRQSGVYLTFFTGLLIDNYDNGRGVSIICPLYIPSYIGSH